MNANLQTVTDKRAVRITLLWIGIFALIVFVLLVVTLWRTPVVTTLRCTRKNNLCTFTQMRRNQTQNWPVALASLRRAHVVFPSHRGRGVGGYEVYLDGTHANYYFSIYNSLEEAAAVVDSINKFFADDTQPELVIEHDESSLNSLAWVLMIIMPVFVIGMLVFAWRRTMPDSLGPDQ
jgi:hypothetical protein